MAMPASGSIAIISAPQSCGSICAAVGCASGSLTTLSVAAGKTAPHAMTEFYGYSPAPAAIGYANSTCSCNTNPAYSLDCIRGVDTASTCAGVRICWYIQRNVACSINGYATTCLICNGTCTCACSFPGKGTCTFSGCWDIVVANGDCWCSYLTTCVTCLCDFAISYTCMLSVTNCVGNYCLTTGNHANYVNSGVQI